MDAETFNSIIALSGLFVATSSLLVAAIVPFLSARLAKRDTKLQMAMAALVKTRNDAQRFKNAFSGRHPEVWDKLPVEKKVEHHRELLDATIELDGNTLQLGFLFERQADHVGRRVRRLADHAHILFGKPCEDGKTYPIQPHDSCMDRLNVLIKEVCLEMRPLWEIAKNERLYFPSRKMPEPIESSDSPKLAGPKGT